MKYLPLNPEIFVQNRKRFVEKMEKNSIAIFNSNDELPTNGDQLHRFKQNSDLFWLTGVEQEDTMLILFPDNKFSLSNLHEDSQSQILTPVYLVK